MDRPVVPSNRVHGEIRVEELGSSIGPLPEHFKLMSEICVLHRSVPCREGRETNLSERTRRALWAGHSNSRADDMAHR